MAGKWEFPGGKIEPGESPEQSLARELAEELDVRARIGQLLCRTSYEGDGVSLELLVYRVECFEGTPVLREHEEMRWVPPGELRSFDLADSDRKVVETLYRIRGRGEASAAGVPATRARGRPGRNVRYFFALAFSEASLKVLLKVNRGTFVAGLAGIMISCPVRRVPARCAAARRSDTDEHLADLADGNPLSAHDAGADDLEEVLQDLLHVLADQPVLLRKIANQRCAGELVRDLGCRLL